MANNREYKSRIDELRKRMYEREAPSSSRHETTLHEKDYRVSSDWQDDQTPLPSKSTSLLNKILIAAVVFFVGALAYAFISLQSGTNVISSENIRISINAPREVDAGETIEYTVEVKNGNDVTLSNVALLVDYPTGARDPEDATEEKRRDRVEFGTIDPGGTKEAQLSVLLFGEQNDTKVISVGIEYKIPNSSAIFFTDKTHSVVIGSSPVTLSVDSPKSINSGQEVTYDLTLTSNADQILNDLRLVAEYPTGFTFLEASKEPTIESEVWEIGDLRVEGEYTLSITGVLTGQNGDERTARFLVGVGEERNERVIATPLVETQFTTKIESTFLDLDLSLNGRTSNSVVVQPGSKVRGDVLWENNLTYPITNAVLTVTLDGRGLDKSSIEPERGIYDSTNNRVVWDRRSLSELGTLEAGEDGSIEFVFNTLPSASLSAGSSTITITVEMTGERLGGGGDGEQIETTIHKEITLNSSLDIAVSASHSNGPLPPVAGEETRYDVELSIAPPLNPVENGVVTAHLPSNVRVKNVPGGDEVTFNAVTGELVWTVGDISAGRGESVLFTIALTPGSNEVGRTPIIMQSIEARAQDATANTTITDNEADLTTRLRNPILDVEDATVIR